MNTLLHPRTYVPPSGPLDAKIVFVGEQPGRTEGKLRRPFVGPAGENLDQCLQAAGIPRSQCRFTNVIKDLDAPLKDYIIFTTGKNAKGILSPLGREYLEILKTELDNSGCNIVVPLGNVALWALCGRLGITAWRGSILDSTLCPGLKVCPTLHPATWTADKLYKNPSAYLNKYLVILDLKKVKFEGEYPEIRRLDRELRICPTYPEALQFLTECLIHGMNGTVIDYDIEILPGNQELSCISLAIGPQRCMSIAFVDSHGDLFSIEQETHIMTALARILENPRIVKGGQNIIFDSHYLFRKYGITTLNYHDTMIAQKILYPELRVGLDSITAMWTDIPYYKKEGKIWLGGEGTWENGWKYNCLDSISCADARPKQLQELSQVGNLAAYERQVKLVEPLTYMMEHGIRVDLEGMERAKHTNELEIQKLTRELSLILGPNINIASPKQLCEYFYTTKGIKPYLGQTDSPTVDANALKRLASTHGLHEASLILEIRKLSKNNSTFLDPSNVDPDGRIRCSYNPVGTRFSRISSSANIFGTGMNLQNVPHHCLTHFKIDPGFIGYSLDYSQYENRIVAYVGNISRMIEVFEHGLDSHRMTAALILTIMGQKTSYEAVTPDERQDYGKIPNHAFNYGLGPNTFSLMHELPIATGKQIYHAYHSAYPELKSSYWNYVQKELNKTRTLVNLMDRKITFLGRWGDKLLHESYSCIPQSTCGDDINEHGLLFTYYNTEELFRPVELLTQIHDSIEFQIPLSVPIRDHARILIKIKESMETPLEFQGRVITTPVDLTVNTNLNKEQGYEIKSSKFSSDPNKLSELLKVAGEKLGRTYDI